MFLCLVDEILKHGAQDAQAMTVHSVLSGGVGLEVWGVDERGRERRKQCDEGMKAGILLKVSERGVRGSAKGCLALDGPGVLSEQFLDLVRD